MWEEIQPRRYHYQITPEALICAVMTSFALRLAGLRDIVARFKRALGSDNFSSLSHAMGRPTSLLFVQGLIQRLQSHHRPGAQSLVVLDSMAVTLPWTQRHKCKRVNKRTAGGGVLWAYTVDAPAGTCPVKVLKVMAGAWSDADQIKGVELIAFGPLYVMDRGFYAMARMTQWMSQGVRFVVRARKNVVYEVVRVLSAPRSYGRGQIHFDAVVRLGCPSGKKHCVARLIKAVVGKEEFLLVTGEMRCQAEELLQGYKRRERIEQFHRYLKDTLGLAHLYNFSQTGILFLLHTALLLAMLLFLSEPEVNEEVIAILRRALKEVRARLGLGGVWKRNTISGTRAKRSCKNH